jgi:uncharacterized surface protein with fasciclin (FAS1) repeats
MLGQVLLAWSVCQVTALPYGGGRSRGPKPTKTIGQLVDQEQVLSTFSEAVKRTGLEDMLDGADFITVFAPTNEAFDKIPSDILEDEEELKAVILRHIVPGFPKRRADLPGGDSTLETAGGETITVTKSSSNKISAKSSEGEGKAVRHDVLGTNGVIFWLNGVL